jgi:hypothetical protein
MTAFLTPEELMAGREATYEVEIPPEVLHPSPVGDDDDGADAMAGGKLRLRPLTVADIQLIAKAAKDDEVLTSVLMVKTAVIEPALTDRQVSAMHGGLVRFLVDRINRISGLSSTDDELRELAESPIVQAFFVLAREFNWTAEQVRGMTVGEILGYLELVQQARGGA